MKTKTSKQTITAYIITWDKEYAEKRNGGKFNEIIYLSPIQKSAMKRGKKWKHIINLEPVSETTIITKIKIW